MATPSVELIAQIRRFREALEKSGIRQQQVLLYGSQRHGTATEGSDIDLIVISPDWDPLSRRERLELLGVVAARLLLPIQAQGWTPREITTGTISPFWQEILQKEAVAV
ncbi:MAG: nucleotidyltransferase domain-containing protein [Anaerolineae bacterium]